MTVPVTNLIRHSRTLIGIGLLLVIEGCSTEQATPSNGDSSRVGRDSHHSIWTAYANGTLKQVKVAVAGSDRLANCRVDEYTATIRLWPDSAGRIRRVKAEGLYSEINNRIEGALLDATLDPPPEDMPLPIVMRFKMKSHLKAQEKRRAEQD